MNRIVGQLSLDGHGIVEDAGILIEVRHPEVPSIDMVDLPGIVGQPEGKAKKIEQIIERYLAHDQRTGNHSLYLAVVPASGDVRPNTSMTMKFIQDKQLQSRTIGVFSKCDQTASTDVLRALVTDEYLFEDCSAEALGAVKVKSWIACMLKPPSQKYLHTHNFERLFVQARQELAFFQESEDEHLRALADKNRAGIISLVQDMEKQYLEYLHKTWKEPTMRKILDKLDERVFEFKVHR